MSKTISLDQLPSHVESLLRVAWEGNDSIVLERQGEPVAAVVPMEEYLRLHPETKKTEVKPHKEEKLETTEVLSTLSYELPAELLKAYNSLLDKKFSSGLTADEESELAKLDGQLDEAELATPLVQSTLTKATQQHEQWMRNLRRDFDYRCAYCMVHEQQLGGTKAFCIDHFKPRSKGGRVNDYANLYWACIPCNLFKHDNWQTEEQRRKGYRFADPCREQDYGVHFVESGVGELLPQTLCGEYHVLTLRLNRAWLRRLRLERNQKQERLNEALALQEELEQAVTSCPDAGAETKLRLLSFLRNEIEALQKELEASIPFITLHEESDAE